MRTERALTSQSSMIFVRMDSEGRLYFMIFGSKTKYLKNGCKRALFVVPILISADRLKREKNRKQNKNKNKNKQKNEINKT